MVATQATARFLLDLILRHAVLRDVEVFDRLGEPAVRLFDAPSCRPRGERGGNRDFVVHVMVKAERFIDVGAATLPAAIARMTVAGPVTASPPANRPL